MGSSKFFRIFMLLLVFCPTFSLSHGEINKSLFSIEDYFTVASLNVADMTEDGRWLACTVSTRGDSLPRDNFRYGDPTYIAPFRVDVIVINTDTGEKIELFDEKKQVRSLTWSKDGRMLAFFVYENNAYRLSVWHLDSRKFDDIPIEKNLPISSNSHLDWSPDGNELYFAVREPDWEEKCAEFFSYATNGPVIIHDSEEPFLIWDKMRNRLGNLVVPVIWDRKEEKLAKILPETLLNSI